MNNSRILGSLIAAVMFSAILFAQDDAITLPAGSELHVQLTVTLSSKTSETGDMWTGKVVEPIFGKGGEIVPEGSIVDGHITYLKGPGRVKGKGEMRLVADSIATPDRAKYEIVASLEDAKGGNVTDQEGTLQGPGKGKKGTAVETGVGGAAGAGIGAIAHGGSGALYGAAIGSMAGLAHGVLKKGKDIVVPAGTEMTFAIARETTAKKMPLPR